MRLLGFCIFGSLVAATLSGTSFAQEAQVLDEGDGYKLVRIDDASYQRVFRGVDSAAAGSSTTSSAKATAPLTGEVVSVNSLRGVRDAGLPVWLQLELLRESGYTAWTDVPESALDRPIAAVAVNLDALASLDKALAVKLPPRQKTLGLFDEIGDLIGGVRDALCPKDLDTKSFSVSRSFSAAAPKSQTRSGDQTQVELETRLDGKGTIGADVFYQVSKRCGVPYRATLDHADVKVDASLDGKLGVSGSVGKRFQGDLVAPIRFDLWEYTQSWWVYIFELNLELELGLDVGVRLDAEASASFEAGYETHGDVGLTYRCTAGGCTRIRNQGTSGLDWTKSFDRELEATVKVIPFADTNFTATLDLYGDAIEVAKMRLGLVSALPLTYFGYLGNLCSDANGDGQNELVRAQLLDANAEFYAYVSADLPSRKYFDTFDISALGLGRPVTGPLHGHPGKTGQLSRRHLLFEDLISEGSSVAEPVVQVAALVRPDSTLKLSPRSCHPFSEALRYEVEWGDGSPNYVGPGGNVQHVWRALGEQHPRVRLVSDDAGRDYTERWVDVKTNVSEAAPLPVPVPAPPPAPPPRPIQPRPPCRGCMIP
jgi:hypothetical protein